MPSVPAFELQILSLQPGHCRVPMPRLHAKTCTCEVWRLQQFCLQQTVHNLLQAIKIQLQAGSIPVSGQTWNEGSATPMATAAMSAAVTQAAAFQVSFPSSSCATHQASPLGEKSGHRLMKKMQLYVPLAAVVAAIMPWRASHQ